MSSSSVCASGHPMFLPLDEPIVNLSITMNARIMVATSIHPTLIMVGNTGGKTFVDFSCVVEGSSRVCTQYRSNEICPIGLRISSSGFPADDANLDEP